MKKLQLFVIVMIAILALVAVGCDSAGAGSGDGAETGGDAADDGSGTDDGDETDDDSGTDDADETDQGTDGEGTYDLLGTGYELGFFGYDNVGTVSDVKVFALFFYDTADDGTNIDFGLAFESSASFPIGTFSFAGEYTGTPSVNDLYAPYFEVGAVYDNEDYLVSADAAATIETEAGFDEWYGPEDGSGVTVGTYGQISGGTVTVTDNGNGIYTVTWDLTSTAGAITGTYTGEPQVF